MVGETLLGNPYIFSGPTVPDPVDISLEYLSLCKEYPDTVSIKNMQAHIRHFLDAATIHQFPSTVVQQV